MQNSIVIPSMKNALTINVPFVAMPLAHYVISEANRKLHITYMHVAPPEPLITDLPLGNHSIDELVDVFICNSLFRFTAGYSKNTSTLHFIKENTIVALVIGPLTTCTDLIGVRAGDTSVIGSYYVRAR